MWETAEERELAQNRVEDELCELSAHLNAATARWLQLALRVRDEGGPGGDDLGGWLAFRCGITAREAREYVRVGEALEELPCIAAAFTRGELTFCKVRALTRVATPSSEKGLLELAGSLTASQLERALRAYRRITVEEARDAHELEYLDYYWDEDGSLLLRARLAAEDGTILVKALDAARERVWEQRREEMKARREAASEQGADPFLAEYEPQRPATVEAVVELAHVALAAGPPGSDAKRAELVVHIDAAALTGDAAGRSELEHGPLISPETARRLSCDGETVTQFERDGLPVSVGRRRRTVPPALRRILEARDEGTCSWPGCERRSHLQAHHRLHWARGGETSLENLVLLCFRHHRLVHEGGYTIEEADDGELRFRNRHGVLHPTTPRSPPRGDPERLIDANKRAGPTIDRDTNRNGCGDSFELAYAVDALLDVAQPKSCDECEAGRDDDVVRETPDAEGMDHEGLEYDEICAEDDSDDRKRSGRKAGVLAVPAEQEEHRPVEREAEDSHGDPDDLGVRRLLDGLAASAAKADDTGVGEVSPGEVASNGEAGEYETAGDVLEVSGGQPFRASFSASRNCVTSETRM